MHEDDGIALALIEIDNLDVAVTETRHQFSWRMILSENRFPLFGIMR